MTQTGTDTITTNMRQTLMQISRQVIEDGEL